MGQWDRENHEDSGGGRASTLSPGMKTSPAPSWQMALGTVRGNPGMTEEVTVLRSSLGEMDPRKPGPNLPPAARTQQAQRPERKPSARELRGDVMRSPNESHTFLTPVLAHRHGQKWDLTQKWCSG